MDRTTATPWREIETVLRWLAEGVKATSSTRARFYAWLVIELLNRRGVRTIGPLDSPVDFPLLEHRAPEMPYSAMFRWTRSETGVRQLEGCVVRRTDGRPFLPSDMAKLGWRQMQTEDVEGRRDALRRRQRRGRAARSGTAPPQSSTAGGAGDSHTRRRYDDSHFERVARLYDEALELGDAAPVRYVAKQTGLKHSTVKNHVAQARKIGLLPPTEQRKARGNTRIPAS